MKTNNKTSDERWKDIFREIPMEEPSSDFTKNLMFQIEKEAARQKTNKQWIWLGWIASGITGILGIPALILYFMGIGIPKSEKMIDMPNLFVSSFSALKELNINPSIVLLGLTILILLIGDTLFRKLIRHRKEEHLHHA